MSHYWARILSFAALSFFIFIPFAFIIVGFSGLDESPDMFGAIVTDATALIWAGGSFLPFFLASTAVEAGRIGGLRHFFGMAWRRNSGGDFLKGLAAGPAIMLVYAGSAIIFGARPTTSGMFQVDTFLYFSSATLLFAASEEVIFRGIPLQSLADKFGPIAPSVILSLLFAVVHLANPNVGVLGTINIFIAGLVFCALYFKTLSLWLPISFHFSWNWAQAAFLDSNISGNPVNYEAVILDFDIETLPAFLFGGDFGIEGGILAPILLIAATVVLMRSSSPAPETAAFLFERKYLESKLRDGKSITRQK